MVPYTVLDKNGRGSISNIAAAMQSIVGRGDIKIVNLSLSIDSPNTVLESLCNLLSDSGKIVICSTGNLGRSKISYPARYNSVFAVGAVAADKKRCDSADWGPGKGSNYGAGIDIMAPGDEIIATQSSHASKEKYSKFSGTSFAAPIFSAACALAATHDLTITTKTVRNTIAATSTDLYSKGWDIYSGYGLLKMDAFINHFIKKASAVTKPKNALTIELNSSSLSMVPGDTEYLKVKKEGLPITWSSSKPEVATVKSGRVSAVAPGSSTITATLTGSNICASCIVTVHERFEYSAHVSTIGWIYGLKAGEIAGTTGKGLALEALRFDTMGTDLGVEANAHVQNIGWQGSRSVGQLIGTTGRSLHMEAIKIKLTGKRADENDIFYRGHVQNYGWTAWARNGGPVGTEGKNLQLEALQIVVLPKGSTAPNSKGDVNWTFEK